MQFLTITFAFLTLLTAGLAQTTAPVNTTREFAVRTCLKSGQPGKQRFDNLWLYSYHTGAGLGDATFDAQRTSDAAKGFLSTTNVTSASGMKFYNLAFDLGNSFAWEMIMAENVNFYAAWEPVRINAGLSSSTDSGLTGGFFLNSTGVQWTSSPGDNEGSDAFGGWLVCDWWHEVPQLFFRISYYNTPSKFTPCNCADVDLIPVYL